MTMTLTIERQVHFQARARGRKALRVGPEPPRPAPDPGRVPRVARLMALAIRFEGCCGPARSRTTRRWRGWGT